MAKKYITDKLSAKTASSGITYEGDAIFNGGPDGTFSFDFNNGTTSEFSVNFAGDDFLTVNGGTGVFEVGDIAGLFDGYYLKVDGSNNLLSWKYGQDDQVTFDDNSTVSLYGIGTNNASGAELHIVKGQSNEVTGKLKLNSTTQYLDLEYEDPGATNIFRLYRDYSYTSQPLRIGGNAAANELDDYEEGSYNVKFYLGSSSTAYDGSDFYTFTNMSRYVKIGRNVTLYIKVNYSSPSSTIYNSTSKIGLGNLPFTVAPGQSSGQYGQDPIAINGNYCFNAYDYQAKSGSSLPTEFGFNGVLMPSGYSNTVQNQIGFYKITYSSYTNMHSKTGLTGQEFPLSGPFGTPNELQAVVHYITND